ncbi:MAG TPA: DNA cytosine methyltransferase [Sphingobacteriaceae bacterium]
MTHGSLFSGIGGFDLAADWMGWNNKFHCELNPFGQKVLKHYWPNATSYDDITKTDFTIHRGTIDVLSGGDPCQRNSNANRSGEKVAESLGGEYIRAVRQIMPRWVIRENPAAIRKDAPWPAWRFAAELENLGYIVPTPFKLQACCAGGSIRRQRLFVLGYFPKSDSPGLERHERSEMAQPSKGGQNSNSTGPNWWDPAPRICTDTDGVSSKLDGITFPNWRNESIKGGGTL